MQTVRDYRRIEVRPIAGYLGAEVGVDLRDLDDEVAAELRTAFADHLCLFFRDQILTPTDIEAVGGAFGEMVDTGAAAYVGGGTLASRYISPLIREADHHFGERNNGDLWHSDLSFREQPNAAAALYSVETPSHGGDTMFNSMYAAFDTLSPAMQRICEQLVVVHSARGLYGGDGGGGKSYQKSITAEFGDSALADYMRERIREETQHPLVVAHPVTGRKFLYISGAMAVRFAGMTQAESEPLINYLYEHSQREEFTVRWRWQPNELCIWDNLACMHLAVQDYSGMRREMLRFELAGTKPRAACPESLLTGD
jgi:taurine dioxygenase